MDTWTPASGKVDPAVEQVAQIKAHMPSVYGSIQAKSKEIGVEAFALVRRGARGESDCFYAFEGGRVVGTPFCQAVMADVAVAMVEFGVAYLCIWPTRDGEGTHGAH